MLFRRGLKDEVAEEKGNTEWVERQRRGRQTGEARKHWIKERKQKGLPWGATPPFLKKGTKL